MISLLVTKALLRKNLRNGSEKTKKHAKFAVGGGKGGARACDRHARLVEIRVGLGPVDTERTVGITRAARAELLVAVGVGDGRRATDVVRKELAENGEELCDAVLESLERLRRRHGQTDNARIRQCFLLSG